MSYMKRAWEDEHPEVFESDADCNTEGCIYAEQPLFFSGDDAELNEALDAYLTRTQPHPHDDAD
jgi:hypothetical protein